MKIYRSYVIAFAVGCLLLAAANDVQAQLRAIPAYSPPPTIMPAPRVVAPAQTPYNSRHVNVNVNLNRPNRLRNGFYGGYYPNYYSYGWYDQGYGYNTINNDYVNEYNYAPEPAFPPRNFAVPDAIANEYPTIARLSLQVPTGAEVIINGRKVDITGNRTFESPELKPNETFTFDVKIVWQENGKTVEEKRTMTMKGGDLQSLQYLALPKSTAKLSAN